MTQAAQLAQYGSNNVGLSFKNRIINGDMGIDQRAWSGTVTTDGAYGLDRWQMFSSTGSRYSVTQSSVAPAGFTNSLLVTSLAATSVGSTDYYFLRQNIEGLNCGDLNWGSANAQTVTVSFWVRSSLTGTFGGTLENNAQNRSYPFSYTISAANTWEYKTITVAGDVTGTWLTTNGIGIMLQFGLGVGSTWSDTAGAWTSKASAWSATGATAVVGTNGATFYITGVQLEKGSVATSFDYLPITTEIQLCQRYYFQQGGSNYTRFGGAIALARSTTQATSVPFFPVAMRTFPTVSSVNLSSTTINSTAVSTISLSSEESTPNFPVGPARLNVFVSGGLTSGVGYEWESNNNTTTRITFSAEL